MTVMDSINDTNDQNKPPVRVLKLNGHVGFGSLPDQLVNKAISQPFVFNILCVGETGLGKSTLMETLFNRHFNFTKNSHSIESVKVCSKTYDLEEGSVKLKLTLSETAGFGDNMNKQNDAKAVLEFIEDHYEKYLQEELKMYRSMDTYQDSRIHVCLYFISPTGHGLKAIDLDTMKKLENRVNIIPLIAKSDTVLKSELQVFKAKIMDELRANQVNIYSFPLDDDSIKDVNSLNNSRLPFAVVGNSDEEIRVNGQSTRVRQYPWGTVQIENEQHCDFVHLRDMILRVNMEDLRERTHIAHYAQYRKMRLQQMGYRDEDTLSLKDTYERRRELQKVELLRKEEEMRQIFVQRVKEKEQVLKDAEKDLQDKFETLKNKHLAAKRSIEERKRILDSEIEAFRKRQQLAEQGKLGKQSKKK